MNFPRFELTNAGVEAIQAAVYSGSEISFTSIKLGSGEKPANVRTMTDIVTAVTTVGISSISVANQLAKLEFLLDNNTLEYGFSLREIGIMAEIDGQSILYAYSNAGVNAAYIKPYQSDSYVKMNFEVYVAVGDAENVTAVISGAIGYVKTEDFEAHVTNYNNPHRVTKSDVGLGSVQNVAPSNMKITFTKASSLTVPSSNTTLSTIIGLVAKAVESLRNHLTDNRNPHEVSCSQIGAAKEDHTHTADDIDGVIPVTKGGTGATSLAELKRTVQPRVTYTIDTMAAAGWIESTYSFQGTFKKENYNIDIFLAPSATRAQAVAFGLACLVGSTDENQVSALGRVPDIDIPVLVRATEV